jgi:PAS domain S-box-containing protein
VNKEVSDITSFVSDLPFGAIALDHDSKILLLSTKSTDLLGWSETDLVGKSVHDVLCSRDRLNAHEQEDCYFHHCLSNSETEFGSCFWVTKDGRSISLDFRVFSTSNDKFKAFIFFSDNSELEYSLDEMQKFTAMLESSPSPVVEFDQFGQLIYGNTAFGELLDKFDFNDSGLANVLPPNLEDICCSVLNEHSAGAITVETSVDDHYFEWHFQLIESARIKKIIAYGFDVTEKTLQTISVEKEQAKIRKEFLAKMVHELRTPLNAIVGFSDILISRVGSKLESSHLKRLESIKSAGCQLNDMITDTLEFSKIESGHMSVELSEFSMSELCDTIFEQMRTLAEQKKLDYRQEILTASAIKSDKNKVRQILVNIVSNAIKYTPTGCVHLLLSEVDDFELGDSFKVAVLDTGVGIPEDKIDALFDSYSKVEDQRHAGVQGTGLGLSLVKDMTLLLGGRVSVNSIVDKGSVFELVFPKRYREAA